MFLRVLEIIGSALGVIFIVVQIILPLIEGNKIVPMFRRRAKLEKAIVELNEAEDESELERHIKERTESLKKY